MTDVTVDRPRPRLRLVDGGGALLGPTAGRGAAASTDVFVPGLEYAGTVAARRPVGELLGLLWPLGALAGGLIVLWAAAGPGPGLVVGGLAGLVAFCWLDRVRTRPNRWSSTARTPFAHGGQDRDDELDDEDGGGR